MQKDAIFRQRKELKKKSHGVVRSHFFLLVFLMLILSVFGTEFKSSLSFLDYRSTGKETEENDPGNILSADDIVSSSDVWSAVLTGQLDVGEAGAEKLEQELIEKSASSKALGRTNGILAQIVNMTGSGKLFAMFARTIRTLTKSDKTTSMVFILASFLWYMLIFIFIKNILSAAIRRVFLEARIYEKVSFLDILHFAAVRRWFHACRVLLAEYIWYTLWCLTIIGGVIKHYSYWAVPYIVAENPSIGAREAVTLSRRMMDGHKWELFKYELTFIGWILLSGITFGIADLAYGAAYRMAAYAEFYVKVREDAFGRKVEGTEALDDRYLFEKADKILLYETYFDVVDELTILHENRIEITGWKKKISDWFGLWFGRLWQKRAYDEQEGRICSVQQYKLSMEGVAYPNWLNPRWNKKELDRKNHFNYLRSYTIWTVFLLFIAFSFVGWSWEVALHYMQTGQFANRGTLHGPWLPIYGTGGVIVLLLCSRFRKKPVVEFFTAIALCGVLEYFSGWYLETTYHQRWWSYDGYFLNLHGRICAEGLLVFGVGCCAVVYLIAPLFDYLLSRIRGKVLVGIAAAFMAVFGVDQVYSAKNPNMAEGAIEAAETEGSAETESGGMLPGSFETEGKETVSA